MQIYHHPSPFITETGEIINGLEIAYHTWGALNGTKDNVIWICHALTANSDAADWWPGMIGPGLCFDTDKYNVVCANVLDLAMALQVRCPSILIQTGNGSILFLRSPSGIL